MLCMSSPVDITLEATGSITAIIGLGANMPSNFGSPLETLSEAMKRLKAKYSEIACSSFYQTEAVDCAPGTADFINVVVALKLNLQSSASELLLYLQELEKNFGRVDSDSENAPRPLDLDILWFGNQQVSAPGLTIPHPRATRRRFVMEPLAEIAPNLIVTGESKTALALLESLPLLPAVSRLS